MKIIVPRKEYATFIECDVYNKNLLGEPIFLYNTTYKKDVVNLETYKKLLRYDNTIEYLEHQLELLKLINGDKELINVIENTLNKLTRDEVIQ